MHKVCVYEDERRYACIRYGYMRMGEVMEYRGRVWVNENKRRYGIRECNHVIIGPQLVELVLG